MLAKSMVFHEMRKFLQFSSKKFIETSKDGSFYEKCQVFRKCMSFRAFSRNEPLFPTFSLKVYQNTKTWQFVRKTTSFDEIHDFSCFFTK